MGESSDTSAKSLHAAALVWLWLAVAHGVAVLGVAITVAICILPISTLQAVVEAHASVPQIMSQSAPALALHFGLSACLWAFVVILYQLWQRPPKRLVKVLGRTGNVMAETLVVLPVFMFLTFGMIQLAINNVAGILANVAVYQAARAAWVWQPEVDVERVNQALSWEDARERVRVSAALAMTPAAPGNYLSDPTGSDTFESTRFGMAASQIPMGAGLGGVGSLLSAAGSVDPTIATRENLSVSTALDESSFLRRTLLKFTHAYEATEVEILEDSSNGRLGASLTYRHHQVIPLVNRVFGEFDTVGLRMGYFTTMTREYTFAEQPYQPNATLPDGSFKGSSGSSDGGGLGDVDDFSF